MKKFLLLTGSSLVLIVMSLAVLRLQITSFIVIQALKRAGMTNIVFIPTALNSQSLIVNRFSCALPGAGSRIVGRDLRINWHPSILHDKQVNTIFINTLNVDLARDTRQSPPLPLQQRITAGMRQLQKIRPPSLGNLLPFQKLQVKKLFITGQSTGPLNGRELSLELEKKSNKITAKILPARGRLQLQASITDSSTMVVQLESRKQQAPFVRAELAFHGKKIKALLTVNLDELHLINPLLAAELPKMNGELSCSLTLSRQDKPHVDGEIRLADFNLAGIDMETGTLHLHGRPDTTQGIVFRGKAILNNTNINQAGVRIDRIQINLQDGRLIPKSPMQWTAGITAILNNISTPRLHCDAITLPLVSVSSAADKTIIVQIKTEQPLIGKGLRGKSYSLAGFHLMPESNTRLTVSFGRALSWSMEPGHEQVTIDTIHLPELVLDPDPFIINLRQLNGTGDRWHLQTTLTCPAIHLQAGKTGTEITDISLKLQGDNNEIYGNGTGKLNQIPGLFSIRLAHNMKSEKGEAVINTDRPLLFSPSTPLSAAVGEWPLPADLTGGELQIKSFLHWPVLRINSRISLHNGKGFFKNIHFSGLSTSQSLQVVPVLKSRRAEPLTIKTINVGVPLHDFSTKIQLKPSGKPLPVLLLKNSRVSLLGGSISNDYIELDPLKPALRTTIHLHNINLADLLTLQQIKGLKVTGSVSGELPIRLDDEGLHVDNGRLRNERPGGIIEYTPPGDNGLKNSPLTGYALKALEEFHYNLLSASADYKPDGTLEVKLHLEGKSPKLDTDRPVHLNITTEQNLLSLLKSLQYSDSLTNEIDREVQQHFHKNSSP